MNFRTTGILFGLLAAGLVTFFFVMRMQTPAEREKAGKWLFPSLNDEKNAAKTSDFTRVVIDRTGDKKEPEHLEFTRQGSFWRMAAPKTVRADASAVDRLIDQVAHAQKPSSPSKAKSASLGEYGLDNPAVKVTLYKGEQAFTLALGKQTEQKDPLVFVASSEAPQTPVPITKSQLDKAFASVTDFRDKSLFGSSFDISALHIAGANRKPLELQKENDKDWVYKEPKLGDADNQAVQDYLLAVTGIKVEKNDDFVADGKMDDAALAKYGLGEGKAAYVVTTKRKSPEDAKETITETLLIGARDTTAESQATARRAARFVFEAVTAQPPALTAALGPIAAEAARAKNDKDAGGAYFAKRADDSAIVRIDGKHIKTLEKTVDDFRNKHLVKIDGTRADAINMTAKGETLRLRRPLLKVAGGAASAPEWDLYSDSRAKVKSHPNSVTQLIDDLNKVAVNDGKGFLDSDDKQRAWFVDKDGKPEPIDLGLDKPQAELAIWLDGIERKDDKPVGDGEPKIRDAAKTKPNIKLLFGRRDDKRSVVYVKRQISDDSSTILAIPDPFFEAAPPAPPTGPQPPIGRAAVHITQRVTEGYLAYRDHTLPSFRLDTASKLTYLRAGETYDVEKSEKKDDKGATTSEWLLKKPVEGKAHNVDMLLNMLLNLQVAPETLLTDRPTERDVKEKFGLDKPFIKAVVSVKEKDSKTSEFTYLVGKRTEADSAKPNHFYARLEKKPAEGEPPDTNQFVFLLPWVTVQTLDSELRDGTIFADEKTAKPEELILSWHSVGADKKATDAKLELAYKDQKTWAVKSLTINGKDAKTELPRLDTIKIEALLGLTAAPTSGPRLNPLVTQRFVIHNGKPDAAMGLDPASKEKPPALVVEIRYDDKKTRVLTVGSRFEPKESDAPALAPRAFYYAAASTVPSAVFVLPETEFKALVAGVNFFKAADKISLAR